MSLHATCFSNIPASSRADCLRVTEQNTEDQKETHNVWFVKHQQIFSQHEKLTDKIYSKVID